MRRHESGALKGALVAMSAAMAPRGPHAHGLWLDPDHRAGLVHRRLSIIDPDPRADQPLVDSTGRYRIVFNGEIYNHADLRHRLEDRGARLKTRSDTEVVLELFRYEGPAMLDRLRGMYAIAIHDRERQSLFLARDGFGIKPLYVAEIDGLILVASEVKAVVAACQHLSLSTGGLDPAGLVGFLLLGSVPEPFTLHKHLAPLAPGTWRLVQDGAVQHGHHDSLTRILRDGAEQAETMPAGERPARIARVLGDSVAVHLGADVPVGLFLSAGRDSAAIAALAPQRTIAQALTLDADDPGLEVESFSAARIAGAYAIPHLSAYMNRGDFLADQAHLLARMDQPSIDGINVYFIARAAQQAGLCVALSGIGSDELLGGYPSFWQVPRLTRALSRVPAGIKHLFKRAPGSALLSLAASLRGQPKWRGLFDHSSSLAQIWFLRRALFLPHELDALIDPDLAREGLAALTLPDRLEQTVTDLGIKASTRLKLTALEAQWYMRNQLLRDADWAGMAHGIEIRVPFVDRMLWRDLAPLIAGSDPPVKDDLLNLSPQGLMGLDPQRPKTGFAIPIGPYLSPHQKARGGGGERAWARALLPHFGVTPKPSTPDVAG